MRSRFARLVALIAVGFAFAGCGSGTKTVAVNLREFNYSPDGFTVPAGAEVTLNLKNLGALNHNFHLMRRGSEVSESWEEGDEAGALLNQPNLDGGASATITFTAPNEPGEYQFLCSIPAHFEQGMHGVMTVVAP